MVCLSVSTPYQPSTFSNATSVLQWYPQHIIHKRPSARSDFHQVYTIALPALCNPFRNHPHANELTKGLANLRRGHKVSFGAKLVSVRRVCRSVVAAQVGGEALAHVRGYWNRTGRLEIISLEKCTHLSVLTYCDGLRQLFGQRRRPLMFGFCRAPSCAGGSAALDTQVIDIARKQSD